MKRIFFGWLLFISLIGPARADVGEGIFIQHSDTQLIQGLCIFTFDVSANLGSDMEAVTLDIGLMIKGKQVGHQILEVGDVGFSLADSAKQAMLEISSCGSDIDPPFNGNDIDGFKILSAKAIIGGAETDLLAAGLVTAGAASFIPLPITVGP